MRFFVLFMWCLFSNSAMADDVDEGMKAYAQKNYIHAANLFRKPAEQGNALSQYHLGLMYAKGDGVAQDYQQALVWLRKAADQAVGGAEYNLAILYDNGLGVIKDYPQAISWYRKAAEHGVSLAFFNLGSMYDNGLGVTQDYAQAVSLYKQAAEKGVAQAQYNLAVMLESGLGVAQNHSQAAMWYRRAADQGIVQAKLALDDMTNKGLAQPHKTPPVINKSVEQEVVATVQQWAKAWSAKNVADYLAFYAANFKTPDELSLSEWKTLRQIQIEKPRSIKVFIADIQVRLTDEANAEVRFNQFYRSSLLKDATDKTLTLSLSNGKWLIQREESKPFTSRRKRSKALEA